MLRLVDYVLEDGCAGKFRFSVLVLLLGDSVESGTEAVLIYTPRQATAVVDRLYERGIDLVDYQTIIWLVEQFRRYQHTKGKRLRWYTGEEAQMIIELCFMAMEDDDEDEDEDEDEDGQTGSDMMGKKTLH